MDVVNLTKELIAFNTINPPGNEAQVAEFTGNILKGSGFDVGYYEYGHNRKHLIAEKGVPPSGKPLVFSGHFDVVPLGAREWAKDPFVSSVEGDKLYGRGSSDMKSGLAAIIIAVTEIPDSELPPQGIRLIFTAGEELGCQGAADLVKTCKNLGDAGALIIAEPTGNIPATGHKGAIYINASASGKTAHSSMPHLGINAVYKAAKAVTKIENFSFDVEEDSLLGYPTINVGKFNGGLNLNSVPDHAEFTIDMRTTPSVEHKEIFERLSMELGDDISLVRLVDLPPVSSNSDDDFIQKVFQSCTKEGIDPLARPALPYLTDGSVLQNYYNKVPAIILGPGEPGMAHQTDEYCLISKIEQSVRIFKQIILT